jgi:hypothetical protein
LRTRLPQVIVLPPFSFGDSVVYYIIFVYHHHPEIHGVHPVFAASQEPEDGRVVNMPINPRDLVYPEMILGGTTL